jgi:methylated-DNA-[protein]-cysteine S-methyltransferase
MGIKVKKKIDWSVYTPFQQKVLKLACGILPGKVLTYKEVAERLGDAKLARAVGGALKRNRHAPDIPCHRVVGCKGIGGYSGRGGKRRKQIMLRKEGVKFIN